MRAWGPSRYLGCHRLLNGKHATLRPRIERRGRAWCEGQRIDVGVGQSVIHRRPTAAAVGAQVHATARHPGKDRTRVAQWVYRKRIHWSAVGATAAKTI